MFLELRSWVGRFSERSRAEACVATRFMPLAGALAHVCRTFPARCSSSAWSLTRRRFDGAASRRSQYLPAGVLR